MLDFSKAFDLIYHHLLLDKLQSCGLPAHILRWMATFLLDRAQRVKIGNEYSHSGHPNGGVPQGKFSEPKCFLIYINDLRTTVPLYKYVDDSTLFEICDRNDVSVIQESVDIAARWTEQKYFDKIKIGTHRLNYLLPDKRHIEYNIRQQNVYPLPVTRTNRFRNSFIPWALYNCQ